MLSETRRCAAYWPQEEGAGAARNASLVDTQMVTDAATLSIGDNWGRSRLTTAEYKQARILSCYKTQMNLDGLGRKQQTRPTLSVDL